MLQPFTAADQDAILDSNGTEVVKYMYDAWGKPIAKTGTMATTLGTLNPFRYRGYVFDEETGLSYLSSRYFYSIICRFINADDRISASNDCINNNAIAYCGNNPVYRADITGHSWFIAAFVSGVVNVATTYIAAKITGQDYTLQDAGVCFVAGAVNVVPVVGPLLSGTITGGYTAYMAYENGASWEEAVLCGSIAGIASTCSISNIAGFCGTESNLITNVAVDLVFGAGNNTIAAATYKGVTENASTRNKHIQRNPADSQTNIHEKQPLIHKPTLVNTPYCFVRE